MAGAELIDESYALVAASSYADFARRTGALTVLPNALISLARVYTREGRFEDADVALTEASQLRRATGAPGIPNISTEQQLFLQCWRGNEAEASVQAAALTAARKPASPGSDLVAAHRRQRRRREAREQLGAALDAFACMGAHGFAGRAQAELEATGVHPTTRRPGVSSGLTAQETQVARLAAAGDTNREAAAKLFLSPATVDHHLRHIYQKLGVSSRTQLARKMSEAR
jgi:DNA-binding CsgD family transcriptional regulator